MKVNVGAGHDIKDGYVNLDACKFDGIDIVHDLNRLPLPFKDDSVDEFYCKDVLEHVDYIPLLRDMLRCLRKDGRIVAMVPHYTSTNMYSDPQHRNFFAIRSFSFFCKENPHFDWAVKPYCYDFEFQRLARSRITFPRHFLWDRINEFLVNVHPKVQMLYELTAWHAFFPAENVEVELVK